MAGPSAVFAQKRVYLVISCVAVLALAIMQRARPTVQSTVAPRAGPSTPLQVKLEINRIPLHNQKATLSCTVQSILDAPHTTLDVILPANVHRANGATHWEGRVAPGQPASLSVSVLFNAVGDVEVTCKAHRQLDADNSWGDISSLYLSIGEKQSHRGLDNDVPSVRYLGDGETQPDSAHLSAGPLPPRTSPLPAPPAVAPVPSNTASRLERPQSPAGTLTLIGRWLYVARSGGPVGANEFLVELVKSDGTHLAYCYTDVDGYYACGPVPNPGDAGIHIYLRTRVTYFPSGDVLQVVRPGCGTDTSCTHYADSGSLVFADGTYNVGTFEVSGIALGAWWLKDDLDRAWKFVWLNTGATQNPSESAGPGTIVWSYDSIDGTYYNPGGQIYLDGQDPLSHDTAIHEYAHNIMYNLYGYFPLNDCPSPHYIQFASGPNCGWTEGWADFFPLAVNADPVYHWPSGASLNLETPAWGAYYWDIGDNVEGRVAGALWDIFDSSNDGYDQFTDGVASIWDTIFHQSDNTFFQYWEAWVSREHNQREAVWSVYQNTIDYRDYTFRANMPFVALP